jgi:alpha-glucosidase
MVVGEVALQDLHRVVSYLESGDQLHLAHNFVFVDQSWDAETFRTSIDDFEALTEQTAWPAWFLANHDKPRVATRYDHDGLGRERVRAVAVMLYALRGTPFIYQGEELGLPDAEIPPDRIVDVDGRDPERAPIPWRPPSAAGPGAGFTTGEPWLPLVAEAETLCVEAQSQDPRSTLELVRRLARLRAEAPALQSGTQRTLETIDGVLAWVRGDSILAAVNFTDAPLPLEVPDGARLLLSSDPDRADVPATLGPSEAVLLALA